MKIDLNKSNVVGVVTNFDDLERTEPFLPSSERSLDLIEIRFDSPVFLGDLSRLEERLKKGLSLPLILTVRDPKEGGMSPMFDINTREEIYLRFLPYASMVDIEIDNLPALDRVRAVAFEQDKSVIGSYHDFSGVPTLSEAMSLAKQATVAQCSVVKFALTGVSDDDLIAMLKIFQLRKSPMSIMSMGKFGKVSRLLFAKLGSVLNYGYLGGEAQVTGQWPAVLLKRRIEEL